ncbi:unnamed protein product [Pseudo-nitzschia multistriata]|uniref:Uncharacterized protein n=1 Tax=Pseudo-nitzschia multistriata TaxID=183589 RepID=A0A448YZR8_9STRA|nr:unnamed protein product [Pseudo-nitzschia multistriata]
MALSPQPLLSDLMRPVHGILDFRTGISPFLQDVDTFERKKLCWNRRRRRECDAVTVSVERMLSLFVIFQLVAVISYVNPV